jgi:fibronectin type 3 domain-containing protein
MKKRIYIALSIVLVIVGAFVAIKTHSRASVNKDLSLSVHKSYVDLTWTASTTPNVNYNIYRSTVPGAYYTLVASNVAGVSYSDKVPNPGTFYYVIRSVDASGAESIDSNETTAVVP